MSESKKRILSDLFISIRQNGVELIVDCLSLVAVIFLIYVILSQ
jgi:hypothetical protein